MSAAISALTGGRPVRWGQGPLAGGQAAVPAQDDAGSDQPVCSQPSGQEDGAVGPVEPGRGPQRPTGCAGRYCRTARSPAGSDIPARVPGTEHPAHERTGDACPLRPPGQRHALPDRRISHQRTRPSRPHHPGSHRGAGRTYGDARSTQRLTSSRNTRPARPVRGRPWKSRRCTPTVLAARTPSAMSVDTATQRSTAIQGDTRRDREETAR
jgi:hypothetical protein